MNLSLDTNSLALLPAQDKALPQGAVTWRQAALFFTMQIDGALDVARLQQALAQWCERNDALRLRVGHAAGFRGLRQYVAQPVPEPRLTRIAGNDEQAHEAWFNCAFDRQSSAPVAVLVSEQAPAQWQLTFAIARPWVDAGSLPRLAESLADCYHNVAADEERGEFDQYLQWRNEVIQDEDASTARHYWSNLFEAGQTPLQLPWRKAQGTGPKLPIERRELPLDAQLLASLQGLNQPLERVLQAAWWLLLARLEGQPRQHVEWQLDSRQEYEFFADTAGVFEKHLPLLIEAPADSSFRDWLQALAERLEQHATWQEYYSPELIPALGAATCGFSLHPSQAVLPTGWRVMQAPVLDSDLELLLRVDLASATAFLDYQPACYAPEAATLLLDQYLALLVSIAADADSPLARLSVLDAGRRQRLLAINPPQDAMAPAPLLPQRIAQWVASQPDALAIVDDTQSLTWRQLDELASRLARQLAAQGVAAGSVVALSLPRSAQWLAAVLACWQRGAAYLPLDLSWPLARRQALMVQALATVQIDAHSFADLPACDGALTTVEVLPDTAAYVLFTSGSTGVPKGVVIEHRQLAGYLQAAEQALTLQQCKHFAFSATVAADLGHTSLFGALYTGATLHVASDAVMQDPQAFSTFLRHQQIDCLKIVPSHLAALLEAPDTCLPHTLVLGGEAPAASVLARIAQVAPHSRVFNHYGPTEATVGVMVQALQGGPACSGLGQVLAGNRVYVLRADLQLAGEGELGELYIGGRQLCRGYLAQEHGDERFIDDPLVPGQRLYRTGDLARYQLDGSVLLCGRRDHQVKVRGYRIELAEIEARVLAIDGVEQGAVIARQDGAGLTELLACFSLQAGCTAPDVEQLKALLAEQLPAVMVPAQGLRLERLPRLANGKIDRQALAALPPQAVEAQDARAPENALQALLAQRMAHLLGRERLGIDTDFFAAGGHSLLIIKLVAGIRKQLNCEIAPGVVFEHSTVASLAQVLIAQESSPGQMIKIAEARLRLEQMSPEEKAALLARSRSTAV